MFAKKSNFSQGYDDSYNYYYFNWSGENPRNSSRTYVHNGKNVQPPVYHTVISIDRYGNLVNLQSEYVSELLGR